MTRISLTAFVLVFGAFAVWNGHAQVTTGTISGTATDSTGAMMPGAKIVVQNEDTGISRAVTTDAAGRYLAPSLGLGNYRVTASMEGFQTEVRRGIVLTVGREAVVNLQLSVGAVSQLVEVTAEAPLVETTQATVGYLVNDRTVRDLPLNGRDLAQLVLLNPGVALAANGVTGTAFSGWAPKISIAGSRSEDSTYLLDGSYINDMNHHIPSGPSGALLGVETVREFQVLTNSFGAQYGRTLGGVFNAVSKSGTNELHGNGYEFLRNSALDARKFFDRKLFPTDPRLPPFRRNQFGATLGGPIQKDKAFFFVAYEGMREALANTRISVVPDANARLGILGTRTVPVSDKIKPFLPLFPLPSPQGRNFGDGTAESIFQVPQPTHDDFGQVRGDHQLSANDAVFARFSASNSEQSVVPSYLGFLQIKHMATRLLTLAETHIFSPRMLMTSRFSFNRINPGDDASRPKVDPSLESVPGEGPPDLSPGSGISGLSGYGTPGDFFITNRFSPQADVNLTLRGHALQFGGMLERLQFNENLPNRSFGVWTFGSLQAFLAANPTQWRGTPPQFGNTHRGFRQWFFALYLQDDWKVTPKLTLNLGLRWEPYTVPTEVNGMIVNQRHLLDSFVTSGDPFWLNKSGKDFGPRFGFAWSPFSSGKTAVRGGFGIMFMPNDPTIYRTPTLRNPLFPEFIIPASEATFPNGLATIALARQTSFGVAESIPFENFLSERTLQYNLTVQQQLGGSNVISLGYNGSRGVNWSSFGNYNVPHAKFNGVSLEVPAGATLFNPKYTEVDYYATNANAWYNALVVSFQRRFSAGLQTQVSYTWSKAISEGESSAKTDYSGSGSGSMFYAHDRTVGKSLSGFHVPHVLNVSYSYDLPFGRGMTGVTGRLLSGWQLTGIVSAQSGQPFFPSASVSTAISNLFYNCCRPNRVLGFAGPIIKGGPEQYFDPSAFTAPGSRELGNAGRGILLSPGLAKWDLGVTKNTFLTERWRLQFRAETFNVTNRANFSNPSAGTFTATGGRVGSAGRISSTITSSRQVQLSLKLLF